MLRGLVDKLSSCCFVSYVVWKICGYFSPCLKAKTFWPSCSMKIIWQNFPSSKYIQFIQTLLAICLRLDGETAETHDEKQAKNKWEQRTDHTFNTSFECNELEKRGRSRDRNIVTSCKYLPLKEFETMSWRYRETE